MALGALVGVCIFTMLGLPLPWMLGPMLATILLKIKYPSKIFFPVKWRNPFLIPLGYNIGSSITLTACYEIVAQITGIVSSTAAILLISLLLAWCTMKQTGISKPSAAIGNMPGGLTPMLLICESIPRADINVVAVLQSIRLITTIAVVPMLLMEGFGKTAIDKNIIAAANIEYVDVPIWMLIIVAISGALVAYKIKFPSAFFLGPIIATGIFSVYMGGNLQEVPRWLFALAQLCTGLYLGTCINPFQLKENKKLLPIALIGSLLLIISSLSIGFILSRIYGFSLATVFLATAPGGVTEMCITGMVLGENVSIILAYQLFRMMVLCLVMPISLKWYFTR